MAVPARPVGGASIESGWGQVAHDTAVAQDIQSGALDVAIGANLTIGGGVVTFARPFAGVPIVIVSNNGTNNGANGGETWIPTTNGVTAAGFNIRNTTRSGTNTATQINCSVRWVAIGPRA